MPIFVISFFLQTTWVSDTAENYLVFGSCVSCRARREPFCAWTSEEHAFCLRVFPRGLQTEPKHNRNRQTEGTQEHYVHTESPSIALGACLWRFFTCVGFVCLDPFCVWALFVYVGYFCAWTSEEDPKPKQTNKPKTSSLEGVTQESSGVGASPKVL